MKQWIVAIFVSKFCRYNDDPGAQMLTGCQEMIIMMLLLAKKNQQN